MTQGNRSNVRRLTRVAWFLVMAAIVALLTGLGGAALTWLLDLVEHAAFGFTTGSLAEAATRSNPTRRFLAISVVGVGAAVAWWARRRWGRPVPDPKTADDGASMPIGSTIVETIIQIVNVGAGASIGRESAPRELGALFGDRISAWTRIDETERKIIIACAAGGGLASIYNVPLAGAVFSIETMLGLGVVRGFGFLRGLGVAAVAVAMSYGATWAARVFVPDTFAYHVSGFELSGSLVICMLLLGLVLGPAGHLVGQRFTHMSHAHPAGSRILLVMPLAYLVLAGMAVWQPLVMGNGHALAEDAMNNRVAIASLVALIFLKPLATLLTMRAGASGGRLTPSFATGAAAGALLALVWNKFGAVSLPAVAMAGGAAFLATTSAAPLTALALAVELSGAPIIFLIPTALAVGASWISSRALQRRGIASELGHIHTRVPKL